MAISKRQIGLLVASALVVVAAAGGVTYAIVKARGSARTSTEQQVAAAVKFDLTSKNVDGRPHIGAVPEAVAALKQSGFQPITAGKLTVVGTAGAGGAPLGLLASDDNQTRIGSEADFGALIAEGLGLEYQQAVTSWSDWPLGIQSGKYDLVTSNVTVTEERKDLYDFASYRQDLLGFYVRQDSKITQLQTADDISGLTIVVGSATNQEKILLNWNASLVAKGKAPANLSYYDDTAAGTLAVASGRADAIFGPNANGAFNAASTGNTKLVGTVNGGWPQSAPIAAGTKKNNGLITAVNIVLNKAIEGGQYQEILKRWGLEAEALTSSQINPPGLPRTTK